MAYQTAAYPASAAGAWAGSSQDASAYYNQYYAAYGYSQGYDYSAYYQQQQQQYAGSQETAAKAPDAGSPGSAPPPPPPSSLSDVPPPAPPGSPPSAEAACVGGAVSPPPPPPGGPPPAQPQSGVKTEQKEQPESTAPRASADASTASGYDAAAYAQWYAQTYGSYYGSYPGYDQQQHYAYWQQQQQQQQPQPYAYPSYNPQAPSIPPPAPPKEEPPERSRASSLASSSGFPGSYNAQPPPASLYNHQPHKGHQHGRQPTGANTVPIGPRPPPGDPPASASAAGTPAATTQQTSRFRTPVVIRPQMPAARAGASSTPAYISVGSAQPAAASNSAPASNSAVAAAVAAGAASAAAAAKASSSQSGQWPPSFAAWVTRCFNNARLKNIPDDHLSEKLLAFLERTKADGKMWTTDWDTYPVLMADSPASASAPGEGPSSQVLSPSAPQSRKRNRWGAVADPHGGVVSPHQQQQQQRPLHERSQDADTDEEEHHQYHGSRSAHKALRQAGASASPYDVGQHLSNRKRKKMLALEQQQQQQHQQKQKRRGSAAAMNAAEEMRRRVRAGRFGDGRADGAAPASGATDEDSSGMDMSEDEEAGYARRWGAGGVVVGTCQALEKSYFRLTSQPDPATVRPEPVLERALERLVGLIARGEASYFYSLDQFKGMRQDCTVQHLRNALAVRVYEAHARSSLEYGDTAEFNQCQARLGHLYAEGQPGCMAEFTAYRLMYETVHCATAAGRGGGMAKSLLHTMRNVPRELMGSAEVRHALQVREAVMTHNYSAFFRLYATAPHLGRAIMDVVAEPMRWAGLNAFVKACDLPLPVAAMAQLLGFAPRQEGGGAGAEKEAGEEEQGRRPLPGCMHARLRGEAAAAGSEEEGVAECAAWLRDHGAVVAEKGSELLLDTKASRGKLFVPEVPAKVAHGDENLSVNDFLSRAQRSLAD